MKYMREVVNPVDIGMEHLLPGLNIKLDTIHSDLAGRSTMIGSKVQSIQDSIHNLPTIDTFTGLIHHIAEYQLSRQPTVEAPTAVPINTSSEVPLDVPITSVLIHSKRGLYHNHKSVSSMWHEWFGLGVFAHSPYYFGGTEALNLQHKKWRINFSSSQAKQYSRLLYIVNSVRKCIATGVSEESALQRFDELFLTYSSASSLEKHLKTLS
jgi:hypothetical protein